MNTRLADLKTSEAVSGINVAGYLTAESGVGQAARGYVKALQSLGLNVAANNFELGAPSRKEANSGIQFATNNPFPINLICVNADQIDAFKLQFGESYFAGKYNIAVWWWELPEFPENWWEHFQNFDEIWVGSTYVQQSIAKSSPIPVIVVPPVVVSDRSNRLEKSEIGLDDTKEFLFLSMFDFLSSFERKNPPAVVEAFKKAFTQEQNVRLLLKYINSEKNPEKKAELEQLCASSKVTLIERYLSSGENQDLIALSDAYISLHRSEGLGLPIAEAMSHGKPVIATAWSGNMDFTSVANSYLVPYKLIANRETAEPYKVGDIWAEPDVDEAAKLMKQLFDDKVECAKKAERAALDVQSRFSTESVAAVIEQRLKAIQAFNRTALSGASPEAKGGRDLERAISYQIDDLTEQRLRMIERADDATVTAGAGSSDGNSPSPSAQSKSLIRRLMLPLIEKSGYLNSIYAKLFRKLFVDTARAKTQIELIDARTRRMLADADARIASLEKTVEKLRSSTEQ